jgi:hypothetical protein
MTKLSAGEGSTARVADNAKNLATDRDGPYDLPVEHRRVAVLPTTRTELVKRGTIWISYEDFCHASVDPMLYQVV